MTFSFTRRILLLSALIAFPGMLSPAMVAAAPMEAETKLDTSAPLTGGAGDLLVAPTRVVLEGRTRSEEVVLNNKGTTEATYRISFKHMTMNEEGEYIDLTPEQVATSGVNFADDFLRFSPRQVTLKAGASQVVKVMARRKSGMEEGEYRSHMLFQSVPDASVGQDVEMLDDAGQQIAVRLTPIFGVSIPVFVLHGATSAQAKLDSVSNVKEGVAVTVHRSGNKSLFGDLIVTSKASGKVVGQLLGVSVLLPNSKRNVIIPAKNVGSGNYTIEYRQRVEDGGNVLDKTSAVF